LFLLAYLPNDYQANSNLKAGRCSPSETDVSVLSFHRSIQL